MIVHTFGPAWNTIDLSPFVVKLLTWLRMAQLPCTTQVANVRKMSNAKLPAMTLDDGQLVNDSQQIIDLLRELHQDPLDEQRWSPAEQAVACAWRSLFETDLYFAAYYQRWVPEPNFAILRPVMVDYMGALGVPAFARALAVKAVRRNVLAQLEAQGIGRRPIEQIHGMADHGYAAASDFLAEKLYFMGDRPSELDATVFAFLHTLLLPPFESPQKQLVAGRANLVRYHQRMLRQYWPERDMASA
ncbi:glutathione S-transferase family protein [Variovorax saccharolyticus]|uniref:glutathione S-transferase family protein n=1 Tax=Variovorax saccharolyticus TaxID=3053516 RepID=UPI002575A469|nr:glutathione S-transferase family protein [Variovorax sp. J31P216]MDM0023704.1 glutathione S-transferase family protein [Variovorax sp. J31P216]